MRYGEPSQRITALVRCRTCGAMEGEQCRSLDAHKRTPTHLARRRAARNLVEALAALTGQRVKWEGH